MTIEEALDKLKASDKRIFCEEVRVVCAQLPGVYPFFERESAFHPDK